MYQLRTNKPPPAKRKMANNYTLHDNDVAAQGAFSLLCHLDPTVPSVHRFVPLVQDFGKTDWSFANRVCEPRASILNVTDRWQGVYSVAVGIPDEGRNKSDTQMTFKEGVNRRVSARKYGVHKVQILGDQNVAFGDLALLGPAIYGPNSKMDKSPADNPFVGVYPVKRRTIFFPRQDELEHEAKALVDDAAILARCVAHCKWSRLPALAFSWAKGNGARKVSDFKADYYDPVIAGSNDVFEQAVTKEYAQIKDLTLDEAYALYQWMMVSQMIGVFMSPAEPKSYAQILLM